MKDDSGSNTPTTTRDAACYGLRRVFREAGKRGVRTEQLMVDVPFTLDVLMDQQEWIDWDSFRQIFINLGKYFDYETLENFFSDSKRERSTVQGVQITISRLLYSPSEMWRWLYDGPGCEAAVATGSFICRFDEIEAGHGRIELRMKDGYEPSHELFLMYASLMTIASTALGIPRARVEVTLGERSATYDLRYEERAGPLVKLRRAVMWPFAAREAARDLQRTHAELQARYATLEAEMAARKRAEEEREGLQEQLLQSQRLETVGTLARGLAHDYNNLLQGILGHTLALLQAPRDGNRTVERLEHIRETVRKAAALTKQLSTFSNQTPTPRHPVSIARLVENAMALLKASAPSAIEVHTAIGEDAGLVSADESQLGQVVMNLCINAFQAMEESGGVLKVTLGSYTPVDDEKASFPELGPCRHAALRVTDTGHGMDEATRERIFEPFFTTREPDKGTGLGLSVVYGIVKAHDGAIRVESEPGKGCEVRVYLPLVEADETAEGDRTPRTIELRGAERVLYVDDDPELAQVGEAMLGPLGYTVTAYANSEEALRAFRENPDAFDVLITDQVMPNLPGDELILEARKIRPGIPAIVISGYNETLDLAKQSELELSRILMKPFSAEELAGAVRQALEKTPSDLV